MTTDNEIYPRIPSMKLQELYQLYVSTLYDFFDKDEKLQTEYQQIRTGEGSPFNVNLDIYDIIDEERIDDERTQQNKAILVNPQKQEVIINRQSYPLYAYRTEKERRKALLQKRLLIEYGEESSFRSELEPEDTYETED